MNWSKKVTLGLEFKKLQNKKNFLYQIIILDDI